MASKDSTEGIDDSTELEMKDLVDIQKFIETFDPDETRSLGMNLGLDPIRLKRMKDATLNSDMIAAWINQDDQVLDKCDIPTWRAFARGLDLIKKRKFVQKIKEAHPSQGQGTNQNK